MLIVPISGLYEAHLTAADLDRSTIPMGILWNTSACCSIRRAPISTGFRHRHGAG